MKLTFLIRKMSIIIIIIITLPIYQKSKKHEEAL